VWDIVTRTVLTEPLRYAEFIDAVFTPDDRVRTATRAGTQRMVWDVKRARASPALMKHRDQVTGAEFSPDGSKVLTRSSTATIWDLQTGKQVSFVKQRPDVAIDAARFSPDGRKVVTVSSNGVIQVWDASTGGSLNAPMQQEPMQQEPTHTQGAEFSLDGSKILTSNVTARVWNAKTGELLSQSKKSEDSETLNVAHFSADATKVVTGSSHKTARVWDAVTGNPLTAPMKHSAPVLNAEFSRDSQRVVTACGAPVADMPDFGYAQVWEAATGKPLTEPIRYHSYLSCAHVSPDGSQLVTGYLDGVVRIWDAQTARPLTEPMKHEAEAEVRDVEFSTDGRRIATVVANSERQVGYAQVWDASTGVPLTDPMRHACNAEAVRFNPVGCQLVTACSDTAQVWDIGPIQTVPGWLTSRRQRAASYSARRASWNRCQTPSQGWKFSVGRWLSYLRPTGGPN
jgi:WD40 repeat protein